MLTTYEDQPDMLLHELSDGTEIQSSAFCTYGNCFGIAERDAAAEDEHGIQIDIYNTSQVDESGSPLYVTSVPLATMAEFVGLSSAAIASRQGQSGQLDPGTMLDLITTLLPDPEHRSKFDRDDLHYLFQSIRAGEFDSYMVDLNSMGRTVVEEDAGRLAVRPLVAAA